MTQDKQITLSWKSGIGVFFGTVLLGLLLYYFGKLAFARPTIYSAVVIAIAVAMQWELRRHVWFWITVAVIVALHVPLVLFVPWTTKWIPAILITPICAGDLAMVIALIKLVEKLVGFTPSGDPSMPTR
jgi:hypothetical protein